MRKLLVEAVQKEKHGLEEATRNEKLSQKRLRESRAAKEELDHWFFFWGWVKAFCPAKTTCFLTGLWRNGPPKARDHGWGGGQ